MGTTILDLYSDLVRVQGLLPKTDDKLNEAVETLKLSIGGEVTEHLRKEYFKGLSTGIYELSDKIRSIVDDVKQFCDNKKATNGISLSSKIKVMLLGETSAGKTTFLQRIFGETCGQTGPDPITAFAVIHTSENLERPRLDIKFKKEFTIKEKDVEKFDKFLKSKEFQYKFDPTTIKPTYKRMEDNFSVEDSSTFPAFIKEANNYPEAFEEIVWHHKQSSGQSKFTDFADFYDMPGSGGADEHSDNLRDAVAKYDADIVLYLLKSDQGMSSDYNYLRELQNQIADKSAKLYFVFQKSNNDAFEDKVIALRDFFEKDENSDAINPLNKIEKMFFNNVQVIDARGDKNDKVAPNIALATILQDFYVLRAENLYNTLAMEKNNPDELNILKADHGKNGVNGHLRKFLEEINRRCNGEEGLPLYSNIESQFKARFCLGDDIEDCYTGDLKVTLKTMNNQLHELVKEVLDTCCEGVLEKNKKFSPTKYVEKFTDVYLSDSEYQMLIYLIQAYHFLRLTYKDKNRNELEETYAKKAVNPILNRLSEYINRLKSVENSISVVRNLIIEEE
ncbi:MAG: dynamin family protein [Bacteroidales bacterium]|nr:dynamin family protein [Bacteroidales bacterium]